MEKLEDDETQKNDETANEMMPAKIDNNRSLADDS